MYKKKVHKRDFTQLNSSMVESDNEREKVNDNKNMIQKSDNEIGKFWNRKNVLTDRLDPII